MNKSISQVLTSRGDLKQSFDFLHSAQLAEELKVCPDGFVVTATFCKLRRSIQEEELRVTCNQQTVWSNCCIVGFLASPNSQQPAGSLAILIPLLLQKQVTRERQHRGWFLGWVASLTIKLEPRKMSALSQCVTQKCH